MRVRKVNESRKRSLDIASRHSLELSHKLQLYRVRVSIRFRSTAPLSSLLGRRLVMAQLVLSGHDKEEASPQYHAPCSLQLAC